MFKSLFKKKNKNEPIPAQNEGENEPQGTSDSFVEEEPVDEVLNQLYESLDPRDPDGYAVAVAEVEYLWTRYRQLCGTSNSVSDEILSQEPFKSKPFLRQVWNTIPRDTNGNLTFPALFGVIKWWESIDQETRLRGIYKLLNTGQPLDMVAIRHIIKALDSNLNEDTVNRRADLLMNLLDDKNQGYINEDQWIRGVKGTLSDEEINQLTKVYILPPSSQSTPQTQSHGSPVGSPVPEEMLITISSKIGERNWKLLAQKLGFSDRDVKSLEKHFPNRSREQAYQMLKHWGKQEGSTKQALELAMRKCGMDDVLTDLHHE